MPQGYSWTSLSAPLAPNTHTCWSGCLWIRSRCVSLVCGFGFSLLGRTLRLWTGYWLWFCSIFNKYLIGFATQTRQVSRIWEMASLKGDSENQDGWRLESKAWEQGAKSAGSRADSDAGDTLATIVPKWGPLGRLPVGSASSSVVEGDKNELRFL